MMMDTFIKPLPILVFFSVTTTLNAHDAPKALPDPTKIPDHTENSNLLSAKDRAQLDRCVDNMIAGSETVSVRIRNNIFVCDYARIRGYGNSSMERYGYNRSNSDFIARMSFVSRTGKHHNRKIQIKFGKDGSVLQTSLFTEFPLDKQETRLVVQFPKDLLMPDRWYTDKSIRNICAFRPGPWQKTANLIAATLAIRLSQSFKYSITAKERAKPVRYFIGLSGENLARKGSQSPELWGVRLKGRTFNSLVKMPPKTTRQQCKNSCRNSRCVGWSFRPAEIASSGRPISARCSIFDAVESLVPGNKYVSALKSGAFVEPIDKIVRPSNICGHLREGADGKVLRVHTFCRPPAGSFFTKITSTDSCDPTWNTCRKYEPAHEVEVVGGDC